MLAVAEPEQLPVAEARAGSPEAWDALFQRYQLPLYAYALELVRDEQTALDIVQETFIRAARHLDSLRADEHFGSWLFGIAHRRCVDRWRTSGRAAPLEPEVAEALLADDENPSELLVRREQEGALMTLVNQLSPPQRAVLLLHFIEDFSLDEIAAITGAHLGTVKSRLHYAKRALRKMMEKNVA